MIEASHKKLEHAAAGRRPPASCWPRRRGRSRPAIFFSLLIIAVAFLPVFALTGQAGRLFKPLAYTKTFVMLIAALLSITFAPALRDLLIRGQDPPRAQTTRSRASSSGSTSRSSTWRCGARSRRSRSGCSRCSRRSPLASAARARVHAAAQRGRHPLHADHLPQHLDRGGQAAAPDPGPDPARASPRSRRVFGKVGRAETPTDPAPLSMVETTVQLKPRRAVAHASRRSAGTRAGRPSWLKPVLAPALARSSAA